VKDTTVAARYARALFIVTESHANTAQALADLKGMWEVLAPGTRVGALLATPQVLLADKRKALAAAFEGKALRSVTLFVDLLLRKKRMKVFESVVPAFEALFEQSQGIKRAQVVSAVPLSEAEATRLHRELERQTGGKIRLTREVDPALLGGALVRIGDRVVDRSVATLLEAIAGQLHEVTV